MDISGFDLRDLLLAAIKSEIESGDYYRAIRDRVKNSFLKERLDFLAREEDRHREFFEKLYADKFSRAPMELPEKSPVPLPELKISEEMIPLSEVFWMAMQAEKGAHDFYLSLSKRYADAPEVQKMLRYIAGMEMGHYRLLESEKENAEKIENYDQEWPMTHMGP